MDKYTNKCNDKCPSYLFFLPKQLCLNVDYDYRIDKPSYECELWQQTPIYSIQVFEEEIIHYSAFVVVPAPSEATLN